MRCVIVLRVILESGGMVENDINRDLIFRTNPMPPSYCGKAKTHLYPQGAGLPLCVVESREEIWRKPCRKENPQEGASTD